MKKLRLDLNKLSVNSFTIEMEDLRGTVDAASVYTETPGQCSHMNMCLPEPITSGLRQEKA
jgi:hypothetical protein